METTPVNIRVWDYAGDSALEDLVLGWSACVCNDGGNKPKQAEIDHGILSIVIAAVDRGDDKRYFGHLAVISGFFDGDTTSIWDPARTSFKGQGTPYLMKPVTGIHPIPSEVVGQTFRGTIHKVNRPKIVNHLLGMNALTEPRQQHPGQQHSITGS